MRRRVRWENVLRVVAAALLVAVVVAWPHLAPPEPGLPGRGAAPLDEPVAAGGGDGRSPADELHAWRRRVAAGGERLRRRSEGARRHAVAREKRKRRPRPRAVRDRVARPRAVEVEPEPIPRLVMPAPVPTAAAPPADPAESEFGFERGG